MRSAACARFAWLTCLLLAVGAGAVDARVPEDDPYEPNDLPPFAFDLRGHEGAWLSAHSGPGVQFEDDWYLVSVPPGRHQLNLDIQGLSGWDVVLRIRGRVGGAR